MGHTIAAVAGFNPGKPRYVKHRNPICYIRTNNGKLIVVYHSERRK